MAFELDHNESLLDMTERFLGVLREEDFDFRNRNLYVIRASLAGAHQRGLSVPGADWVFRHDIEIEGKWSGRGAAIIADMDGHYQEFYPRFRAAGMTDPQADEHSRLAVIGLLIHEFAHVLAEGWFGTEPPIGGNAELARTAFDFHAAGKKVEGPIPERAPWDGHGRSFIRAALHLTDRVWRRWLPKLRPELVFPQARHYGLSPAGDYNQALAIELHGACNTREPIWGILMTASPPPFRQLWRADILKWFAGLEDKSDQAQQWAEHALASSH